MSETSEPVASGEWVIELAARNCGRPIFPPYAENQPLRGRWSQEVTAGKSTDEWLSALHAVCPVIPGIHIALDVTARTARVFDPLHKEDGTAEGKAAWEKMERVIKSHGIERLVGNGPMPTAKRAKLSSDQLKTWAYWMRRLMDGGQAKQISGPAIPSQDAIAALPGAVVSNSNIGGFQEHIRDYEVKDRQPVKSGAA